MSSDSDSPPFPYSLLFFFSYWVFAWFLCYELGWTKYNPYMWLWFALSINIFVLLAMIYYNNDFWDIVMFIVISIFIKVIPIAILWGSPLRWKDFKFGFILGCIQFLFLAINGKIIKHNFFLERLRAIQTNKPNTPVIRYIKSILYK